jgi:hypothetical protein
MWAKSGLRSVAGFFFAHVSLLSPFGRAIPETRVEPHGDGQSDRGSVTRSPIPIFSYRQRGSLAHRAGYARLGADYFPRQSRGSEMQDLPAVHHDTPPA